MDIKHSEKIARFWGINDAIRERITQEKGFSFYLNGDIPSKGFACSLKGYEEKEPLHEIQSKQRSHVFSFLIDNEEILSKDGNFFGCWLDGEDVYLDASKSFDTQEEAIAFGKENEQLAIFDLENKVEIRI